jgi:hypothetical protein
VPGVAEINATTYYHYLMGLVDREKGSSYVRDVYIVNGGPLDLHPCAFSHNAIPWR